MISNWLIDRLLVLGLLAVVTGAVAALSALGSGRIGESGAVAALVASLLTLWLRR